jgi:hypothetical protein
MPHLVERNDDRLGGPSRLGELTGGLANPFQHRDIADAEKTGDAAKAHIAHRVQQHGQRLHLQRFAARWRVREMAAAGLTEIPLPVPNRPTLDVIRALATFADEPHHGSLSPPVNHALLHHYPEMYLKLELST